jgi:hypothetical protein
MKLKFTLGDKAYYIAEYLAELGEEGLLVPRTVCEMYKHSRPGQIGLAVEGATILNWAQQLSGSLNARTTAGRSAEPKS